MPKYRVTSPDGKTYEVTAPEGATQEQVMAYVQSQHNGGGQGMTPDRQAATDRVYGVNPAVADFGRAAIHHAGNFVHGTAQLVEHGLNALSGGALQDMVNQDDAAMRQREADYQASTGNGLPAYAGAAVGEVLPYTVGLPERALSALTAKIAPAGSGLARRIAAGAAGGASMGAVSPTTGESDYARQKAAQIGAGAVAGGALPLTAATIRGTAGAIRSVARPILKPEQVAAENLARLYGSDQATLDALRNAPQYFPGETVTAAQALATPQAAMVEKALRNRPDLKAQFMAADNANNAGRMAVVRDIAGTDQAMTQAIQDRKAATAPYIAKLSQSTVDPAPVVAALKRLQASSLGVNSTLRPAISDLLREIQSRTGKDGKVGADILDAIRQNANDFLAKHAPVGATSTKEQAALVPIKAQIIDALDAAVPGYRAYLATFRSKSAPINTMEAGRRITGTVDQRGLNSSGDTRLSLAVLNSGLNKADKSRYGLDPNARASLLGLRQSLQRESISNSVPSAGSDTAYNLAADGWLGKQIYGPTLAGPTGKGYGIAALLGASAGHSVAPGLLGNVGGAGLAAGLKKAADAVNSRIAQRVGAGAMNSQEAARMIEDFIQHNPRSRQALLKAYPQWAALLTQ